MPEGRGLIGFDKNYSTPKQNPALSAPGVINLSIFYFCGFDVPELFLGAIGLS